MRIERVIIRGLRALRERDDSFIGLDHKVHSALCLRGLNGSGKTTYLIALAELWQWFRRCARSGRIVPPNDESPILPAALVAALITDLPGPQPRRWIAWGHADPQLRRDELTNPRPTIAFAPVARYLPEARGASHLEGLLRTLYLARPERWQLMAKWVSELRPGLQLLDRFDEATQRPLFRLSTGEILTVEHLSAGERSLLINLAMVLRWLAPGGIVLLDEPELHQHLSLMRGSLAVLHSLIAQEFSGQLIVASHAPEVWDHFSATGSIIELEASAP